MLLTPALNSFVELSTHSIFRRRWPSAYEALQDNQPDRYALLDVYLSQLRPTGRPLLVGDHTASAILK